MKHSNEAGAEASADRVREDRHDKIAVVLALILLGSVLYGFPDATVGQLTNFNAAVQYWIEEALGDSRLLEVGAVGVIWFVSARIAFNIAHGVSRALIAWLP